MKRILTIPLLASAICFALFAFMACLVKNQHTVSYNLSDTPIIEIARIPEPSRPHEISRALPKPPQLPEPLPRQQLPLDNNDTGNGLHYQPPTLRLTGLSHDLGPSARLQDSEARPIVRINPKYPIAAARDGQEGWVMLSFDIDELGSVRNVSVIDANPKRVFDSAAKQALRKWKYRAKVTDGKARVQKNLTVRLDFTLEQQKL